MGIFAKRFIEANEELTFNYNVDRYGHEAQECFCGEPNCVGYIGGKTQTDIGGMDDLFLDALGITDEVEAMQLKGSKKKKGRKLDEDFNPTMTQIAIDDVPKVSSAIRQATGNKRIISKLLARILLTEDTVVQRQIMRLHGFSMMSTVLHESGDDNEIVIAVSCQLLVQMLLQFLLIFLYHPRFLEFSPNGRSLPRTSCNLPIWSRWFRD